MHRLVCIFIKFDVLFYGKFLGLLSLSLNVLLLSALLTHQVSYKLKRITPKQSLFKIKSFNTHVFLL